MATASTRAGPRRNRSRLHRAALLLASAAAVLAALCLALAAALWWGQERLIFRPTPLPTEHRWPPAPDVHELQIDVPGARLNALHLRLPRPDGLVFYLHGNAGNLQSWFINPDFYRALNVDLFMLDYRGYGKSSGQIESQAQLLGDLRAAWDQVVPADAGRPVVLYGRSLGSGLAAQLAASLPAALLPGAQVRHIAEAGHNDLQSFPAFLDAVRRGIRGAVAAGR